MRNIVVGMALLAGLGWATVSARQQSVPGLGNGVVTVRGSVDVGNTVPVTQASPWKVDVEHLPDVRVGNKVALAPPEFVGVGRQYRITWTDGTTETLTVVNTGFGAGWISVNRGGGKSWFVNLSVARSVEPI